MRYGYISSGPPSNFVFVGASGNRLLGRYTTDPLRFSRRLLHFAYLTRKTSNCTKLLMLASRSNARNREGNPSRASEGTGSRGSPAVEMKRKRILWGDRAPNTEFASPQANSRIWDLSSCRSRPPAAMSTYDASVEIRLMSLVVAGWVPSRN